MAISGASVVRIELIDRGDPIAYDLTQAAMTMDGAWHDWDMSAIVPAGKTWVLLRVIIQHAGLNRTLSFRKNGNVNTITIQALQTQTVGIQNQDEKLVPCDAGRIIEYMASGAIDSIDIVVLGWV